MFNRARTRSVIQPQPRFWQRVYNILVLLNHAEHYIELSRWARRRRLRGPQRAYQAKLQKIDELLLWQCQRRRSVVVLCEFLFTAYRQITGTGPTRPQRRVYRRPSRRHRRR